MTLEELRALCDAPGWSTGRVARDVCAGRDEETLRRYLRTGEMPNGFARWLERVVRVDERRGRVVVEIEPTSALPGRPPNG